ncbi:MAG: phosphate starvation-inducible protein PhoH [Deltaproteobacteria bacterium CG06_land_8_20_14_3_00_44_19]|nr:MAG: phosphate starvation-inducible protein PhoH [Deltaproteobacteria bacterium CG06_land_8_20_14_3_00_44_19]PIZ20495.1 MAG: phosphate starvation-inducible protein PhoH [Deltaproteobacteria bacterium CG_4_10_14_0_8_um_filter_43_12]
MFLRSEDNEDTVKLNFDDNNLLRTLCGEHNKNLRYIGKTLEVKVNAKGNEISINGACFDVKIAEKVLVELYSLLESGYPIYPNDVDYAVRIVSNDSSANLKHIFLDTVYISSRKRPITPKSLCQKEYIDAIRNFDIVFGIGPAGTGKTYLAMALAISFLMKKEVDRIILARPAVEAGEKLGFLPGDLYEKVNPYLRPLYDALYDMIDFEKASGLVQRGIIEVAPLAFMRGRTLNDSFVILDEAQNTTSEQMKMFLTRLGYSSKAVITGDVTQIDLSAGKTSGLIEAQKILKGIEGINFTYFSEKDVIRHCLVQDVIRAYERYERSRDSV